MQTARNTCEKIGDRARTEDPYVCIISLLALRKRGRVSHIQHDRARGGRFHRGHGNQIRKRQLGRGQQVDVERWSGGRGIQNFHLRLAAGERFKKPLGSAARQHKNTVRMECVQSRSGQAAAAESRRDALALVLLPRRSPLSFLCTAVWHILTGEIASPT